MLFALKIAHPDRVFLNRGNHEDYKICRVYGFWEEFMSKYGNKALYKRICDVFALLPLGCVIGSDALVVHAGLPRTLAVSLADIDDIPRTLLRSTVRAGTEVKNTGWLGCGLGCGLGMMTGSERWTQAQNFAEDLLWSDPLNLEQLDADGEDDMCMVPNLARGAGTKFGPGVARELLTAWGLKTLVRSHQCVAKGWEEIPCGNNISIWTVFSASDYDGVGNMAAVLIFEGESHIPQVMEYSTAQEDTVQTLGPRTRQRLVELICRHKDRLRRELQRHEEKNKPLRSAVKDSEWAAAVKKVLDLTCDVSLLRTELVGPVGDSGIRVGGWVEEAEEDVSFEGDLSKSQTPNVSHCSKGSPGQSTGRGRAPTQTQMQRGMVDVDAFLSRYLVYDIVLTHDAHWCVILIMRECGRLAPHRYQVQVILSSGQATSVCEAEERAIRRKLELQRAEQRHHNESVRAGGPDEKERGKLRRILGHVEGCCGVLLQRPRDIPRAFRLLDSNSNGVVSGGEVHAASKLVNRRLASFQRATAGTFATASVFGGKSLVPGLTADEAAATRVDSSELFRCLDVDAQGEIDVMQWCRAWLRLFTPEFKL